MLENQQYARVKMTLDLSDAWMMQVKLRARRDGRNRLAQEVEWRHAAGQ
ncbi:MAG TPA: hypothetical protein VMS17_31640 [Gemmataceae bacterium]|nr:hypothetical protein [Gemmataceae bacterium]